MAETQRVIIPYSPRKQFVAYHNTDKRWKILVVHRRGGKTVATINEQIRSALTCPLKDPRTAYIAPLHKQAKDVAWGYAKEYGLSIPGALANESELRIDFPNGGRFRLYGSDNPDAMRGIYLDDCVLDEFADMRPRFLPTIIRPALSDRKGKLTVIGTPKGRNEFFDLFEQAKLDPEWYWMLLRASESGLVDPEELKSAAKTMTPAQYAQEFECSFVAAIEGAYYGVLLEQAETQGRIGQFPWNPQKPVYTSWDLGIRHDSAIWFAQRNGGYIDFIDHYAAKNEDAAHYVSLVKAKPYNYAQHYFPHDIDRVDGWVNKTKRLDTLKEMGMKDIKVIDMTPVSDGINAVQLMLPISRFDAEKCAPGLKSLRHYHREYDEERRTFRKTPHDDWTADDADAMRMMAQGLVPEAAIPPDIPSYSKGRWKERGSPGLTTWKSA